MSQQLSVETHFDITPLSDEQARKMEEFSSRARSLQERIHKRRKGKPFPSSWKMIRQTRKEE
jgi:hypothetical protein